MKSWKPGTLDVVERGWPFFKKAKSSSISVWNPIQPRWLGIFFLFSQCFFLSFSLFLSFYLLSFFLSLFFSFFLSYLIVFLFLFILSLFRPFLGSGRWPMLSQIREIFSPSSPFPSPPGHRFRARDAQSEPTLNQDQGPSIRTRDSQSGPGTTNQDRGPPIRARDPQSGTGTLNQGQGLSIRGRERQSGARTLTEAQKYSLRVRH